MGKPAHHCAGLLQLTKTTIKKFIVSPEGVILYSIYHWMRSEKTGTICEAKFNIP